MTGRTYTEF